MLTQQEKILYLEKFLDFPIENYADSFKTDILFFLGEFTVSNRIFHFLKTLVTYNEIEEWVNKLTSRIVLRFDEENEQIEDFIHDYLKYG